MRFTGPLSGYQHEPLATPGTVPVLVSSAPVPVDQFCRCGCCVAMQTRAECTCCHDYSNRTSTVASVPSEPQSGEAAVRISRCLAYHAEFESQILNETSLKMHFYLKRQFLSRNQDVMDIDRMEDKERNKLYRFVAYFSAITWLVQVRLGKRNRMPVPSCMTNRIHNKFRDPHGQYTGYLNVLP